MCEQRLAYGLLLLPLIALTGCQSTSALPSSLARDKSVTPGDIVWRKQPDAATKSNPVQATAFQPGPQSPEPPPIPNLMPTEDAPVRTGPTQPVAFKHGGRHHGGGQFPLALPSAPSEWNPAVLPEYTIRPPDVLLIDSQKGLVPFPIRGQHLVRPDGTVGLGAYGPAPVAGRTLVQAREEIAKVIFSRMRTPKEQRDEKGNIKKDEDGNVLYDSPTRDDVFKGLSVDVLAYNSSVYYIITDGAGLGEQVYRFPVTGNETVLDAIAHINGLPVVASPKRIWVARRNTGHPGPDSMLPVDWKGITQAGNMNTNWQVMPGDRIYVQADPVRRFNNNLGKMLEPVERLLGATLLGGQTVNTIRNGTNVIR